MHKIWLIIKREYLVRVRKKSFIIMTILGPILMAALLIVPIYLADENQENRIIALNEDANYNLEDSEFIHFTTIPTSEAELLKTDFNESPFYALLYIDGENFTLYSNQQISLSVSKSIERQLEQLIEHEKLKLLGIDLQILEDASTEINITTKIISEDGNTSNSQAEASMGIGFLSGILIYMFIFMYGTMVMRGVIEEKTSRIVEVIISSVKPRSFNLAPAITRAPNLAKGTPIALLTNGIVREARGFTSIRNNSPPLIANWIFIRPITPKAFAKS